MQRSMLAGSIASDLAKDWQTVALRGVVIALFGLAFLFAPVFSLTAGTYTLGGFALVYGILALVSGLRSTTNMKVLLLVEGVVGIALGILAFQRPGSVLKWMIYAIAAWAIISGILQVIEAIRLRAEIESEWILGLAGVCSIIFGIIAFATPGDALKTLTVVLGIYAVIFGLLLLMLAFRMKGVAEKIESAAAAIGSRANRA